MMELPSHLLPWDTVKKLLKGAWDEGAECAWQKTGDGHNGEYVDGHGTHDGTVTFTEANGNHNPYQEDE